MSTTEKQHCAILLAMGGPDNLDQVEQYLYNIFSDRSIIRLPGGRVMQRPFAKIISRARRKKVQRHYARIGGRSPLRMWTDSQAAHIESLVKGQQPGFRCYVGMRYTRPSITDVVSQACRDGFKRITFVPMYPQYSKATTGSAFIVAQKALQGLRGVEASFINDFHDHPSYVSLLSNYIKGHIDREATLLFSAHSLPRRFVDEGDPYVQQVETTARLAAAGREYYVSYQSRTGPVEWVGPDTIDEARRLLEEKPGNLFVVPISFVCDHIETLFELDLELKETLASDLARRIRRMPMFNDDVRLAQALTEMIEAKEPSHVEN